MILERGENKRGAGGVRGDLISPSWQVVIGT